MAEGKIKIDIDELSFSKLMEKDTKGWASLFKHPKMPELIQYIQKRHYAELMRDAHNNLLSEEEVRKSVKGRGRAEAYEVLINAFCEAMEGFKNF